MILDMEPEVLSNEEFSERIERLYQYGESEFNSPFFLPNVQDMCKVLNHTCTVYKLLELTEYGSWMILAGTEEKSWMDWLCKHGETIVAMVYAKPSQLIRCRLPKMNYVDRSVTMQKRNNEPLSFHDIFQYGIELTARLNEHLENDKSSSD